MRIFENAVWQNRSRFNTAIIARFCLYAFILLMFFFSLFITLYHFIPRHNTDLFILSTAIKLLILFILAIIIGSAAKKIINLRQSAYLLDHYNEDKADTYQNAYELLHDKQSYDPLILDRIFAKADIKAQQQQYPVFWIIPSNLIFPLLSSFLGIVILITVQFSQIKPAMSYFKTIAPPKVLHKTYVELIPGNLTVGKNLNVTVEVLNPEQNIEHRLFYKLDKDWREIALPTYRKTFENLDYSFTYFVKTPYATSDTFQVKVVDMPAAKRILLRYHYPAYTQLPAETDSISNGNIKALENTEVSIYLLANVPLKSSSINFGDGSSLPMRQIDALNSTISFPIRKSDTYYLRLTDKLNRNSDPIPKTITMLEDTPPEIRFVYPGQDTLLTQNMLLPMRLFASDDFGLQDLVLKYGVNTEPEKTISLKNRFADKMIHYDYILDLGGANLLPGDAVTYYAEIRDNSPKHQVTQTAKFKARFPSVEEIYKEIEREEQEKKEALQYTYEKSKDLQKEFEQKRREMMKKDKADWEDKKELTKLVEKQETMSKQVEDLAQDYQKLIEKLQNNQAVSPETLQKMDKIKELMQEISNEQLQQAMEKMQQAMEKMDTDVLKKAMENFKFSMEDFNKKLEQTINLLESIKKEQALQKALQIAQEMDKLQTDLNKKTESANENNQELAKAQKKISDEMQSLKEQLDKFDKMLDNNKEKEMKEQMEQLQQQMKNDKMEQDMEQSEQSLQKNQRSEASQSQQSASKKMKRMLSKLNDMKSMMSGSGMQDIMEAMQRTIRELLIFSQQQEATSSKYTNNPYTILKDEIAISEGIRISLAKLYSAPQVLMFLSQKFFMDVNFTLQTFRSLFSDINDAIIIKIPEYLPNIQKGLNLTIYDLMQSAQNMQQQSGSGGSGMQSLMQMMQQMGQEQMAMNMLTQQLMQQIGQNGRMSQEQMQQMQRLGADEQRLADNIRRALQNDPEAQKQGNSLQQMADELDAIARQLQSNRIDQSLVDRQERILSRLLDAQKSIHKREFSNKRQAETNQNQDWSTPEEIKLRYEEMRRHALQQDDLKSYPKEYQEVIREYLKLLNEDLNKTGNNK
jgi:hypothetical protein